MRTTPYCRMPSSRKLLSDRAGFPHLREKFVARFLSIPSPIRRRGRPHRRDQRPDDKSSARDVVGERSDLIGRRIDIGMRRGKEQIDAIEFDAVDFGGLRQVEHGVEIDRRLRIRTFADEAGPHGVVQFQECCSSAICSRDSASGLPGPKCFRITSGSESLAFRISTPCAAASGGDEQFVFRHLAEANHGGRRHVVLAEHAVALVTITP